MTQALHNREAERALLGSLIRWNACIDDVVQLVVADDLSVDAHRRVFSGLVALAEQGKPADAVTLANWLHDNGHIPDVRYTYLAELLDAAPTAANAVFYAGIVRDRAILRRLHQACSE